MLVLKLILSSEAYFAPLAEVDELYLELSVIVQKINVETLI